MIIGQTYVPGNKFDINSPEYQTNVNESTKALINQLKCFNKPPKYLYNNHNDMNDDFIYQNHYKNTLNYMDFDPDYYVDGNQPPPIHSILFNHPSFMNIDKQLKDVDVMDIPVPTIPLTLVQPFKENVVAAADTCSNINCIGPKSALKYGKHVSTLKEPVKISTGKGVLECWKYVDIKLFNTPHHKYRFYVVFDLPYNY